MALGPRSWLTGGLRNYLHFIWQVGGLPRGEGHDGSLANTAARRVA